VNPEKLLIFVLLIINHLKQFFMKNFIKISTLSLLIFSCQNTEVEKQELKLEESKCRTELIQFISENGMNTMALAQSIGMGKEVDEFIKLESDTTVTCDSLSKAFDKLSDDVYKKTSK